MAEMYRTRQSFGSQIREALDDAVNTGKLDSWDVDYGDDLHGIRYTLVEKLTSSVYASTVPLKPGEVADWCNAHGYDVRFGKA